LGAALEQSGSRLQTDADAELVLKAYERWGEECPIRILGEFAFALWDARKRQVFCARDIMGVRPLYYWCSNSRFRFASEMHALFEDPAVLRRPNEGFIAECLATADPPLDETLFADIRQLPRAHAMTISSGGVRTWRYWSAANLSEIRLRNDEEYAQQFLEILQEAVRCRLRSHRSVSILLSGGLDSSSIVCVAQSLIDHGLSQQSIESVSVAFPGRDCDEREHIQHVLDASGAKGSTVVERRPGADAHLGCIARYSDLPNAAADETFSPALEYVRDSGGRVVLTGYGGDEWLSGSLYHTADLLSRFRIGEALRQSYLDSRNAYSGTGSWPGAFLRYGVWPLLPQRTKSGIRCVLRREHDEVPAWIAAAFAKRTKLAERLRETPLAGEPFTTIAQREGLSPCIDFPWYSLVDRFASRFGLEYRHPLLDRRVMEFCIALPQRQLRRNGVEKYVLRNAMKGLLPEPVRTRQTKARYGTHAYVEALQDLGGLKLFASLEIASRGWVDGARVRQIYADAVRPAARASSAAPRNLYALWMIASIELWHRAVFSESVTTPNPLTEMHEKSVA
jgi:asparagine synthase (glutamine-hydrolysing)